MADQSHMMIPLLRNPAGYMSGINPTVLPEYASPYCPETDMSGQSVLKRRGMQKWLNRSCENTGLFLNNPYFDAYEERQFIDVSGWAGGETSPWDLTQHSAWTIEIAVIPMRAPRVATSGEEYILTQTLLGSSTWNWKIAFSRSSSGIYQIVFKMIYSIPLPFTLTKTGIDVGEPIHIAIVFDGTYVRLYIDGVEEDTSADLSAATWAQPADDDRVWCGARPYMAYGSGDKHPFHGMVSEIRLWSTNRSAAEILEYHDKELDPEDSDWDYLECYLKCNEGGGTLLHDSSKNNRPGYFHYGPPSPIAGLLSVDSKVNGLIFNGFQYGKGEAGLFAVDEQEWTVEMFIDAKGQLAKTANLADEIGLFHYGSDTDHPLCQIWIEDTSHDIRAKVSVTGPTDYTLDSDTVPLAGTPVHVVVRRREEEVELVINGTVEDSATVGANDGYGTTPTTFYLGWTNLAGHEKFIGIIQELRVWNYARTDQQLADWAWRRLPDARQDETQGALIAYFPLEQTRLHSNEATWFEGGGNTTSWAYTPNLVRPDTDEQWDSHVIRFYPDIADLDGFSYIARWGYSTVTRRPASVVRAITQQQTVIDTAEYAYIEDRPPVRRELVVHAGTSLQVARGARWDFLAGEQNENLPTTFTSVGGYLVACNGISKNLKYDGIEAPSAVGIEPPQRAPLPQQTGSGNYLAGLYSFCYVYRNSATGRRSTRSPYKDQTFTGTPQAQITVYPSADPQVDEIEIYRGLRGTPGSQAIFYYLATVDNSEQTYTDNTGDADVGDMYDADNVAFPPCRYCATYKTWLVTAGNPDSPNTVYFSQAANFEAVAAEYEIGQDDGYPITGLFVLGGVLYVCKERGIYAMAGESPHTMYVSATYLGRGVVGHYAVARVDNYVALVDRDGIYLFNGAEFTKISSPIDDWFDSRTQRLNTEKLRQCCAVSYPEKRQIWFSLHFGDPDPPYGDLLGLWKLDTDPTSDGGNELRDSSGNGSHLTSNGTMTSSDVVDGVFTNALDFDGTDDYLTCPLEAQLKRATRTVTMGAWVKLTSLSGWSGIIGWHDADAYGLQLLYESVKGWRLHLKTASANKWLDSSATPVLDKWTFVVGTFDGNALRIYVDGELTGTLVHASQYGTEVDVRGTFGIGGSATMWKFPGAICNAFISSTVLQQTQIRDLYLRGKRALSGGPVFDQESKTFVYQYDTDKWTLQDKSYSALALIETDKGQRLIGADGQNVVYALDSTDVDGAALTTTLCGIVTDSGTRTFTCANAEFSVYEDGLAGLRVQILDSDGDVWQTRRIISNTATVCTVGEDWSPADIVGYEFIIAGIDWKYRTGHLHFGDVSSTKIPKMLSVAQVANSARTLRYDNGYNICPNGLLDDWTGTLPDNFALDGASTTSQITASLPTSNVRYAVRVQTDAASEGIRTAEFKVQPSTDYTLRFYLKCASATGDTCHLIVQDYTNTSEITAQDIDADGWVRQEVDFSTPATCTEVRLFWRESEDDNIADFQLAEILVVRASDDDLPRAQKVRLKVATDLSDTFTDEDDFSDYIDLTASYQRHDRINNSAGRLIQYELSNPYPGQPVEILAADLDIEVTESGRG